MSRHRLRVNKAGLEYELRAQQLRAHGIDFCWNCLGTELKQATNSHGESYTACAHCKWPLGVTSLDARRRKNGGDK